ncbi:mediator of RNA polymerase II transcription subunit 26-like isoform X2 [Homarus americanus]|uniref:Mediator of RNA polymerase II transcription subunit 26-like 1 n=2 Tax=Homarus americanus TaxID=6706 RepID=A0A8J5MKR3_HOMAM|nr:mediator of RNA polymerase II transcription subunit 26-like isoform X2 [Homarus americanus]XP_042206243.1 mediator of RNA polymerase II transcription subunit 26-like isoform X2 [Homarus americanus]KAG7155123.1 Mediator of RNA polymerase II transcription subunit 26-like 1 [Homarus americanus]
MAACLDLISKLERTPITKEVLESTRLGRHINNIRRKTNHQELYRRSKDLVRKWRKEVLADGVNGAAGPGPGPGGTGSTGTGARGAGNGHPPTSPSSLPSSGNTSPGMSAPTTPSTLVQRTRTASPTLTTAHSSRPLKPASPALLRGRVLSPGLSPALATVSPAITPPLAIPARPRSRPHSPAVNPSMRQPSRADASSYAPSTENVAKTNTANKRLRKDEEESSSDIPVAKRPRNNVTNGFDEDSRESFSSVISNECTSKITSGGSDTSKMRRIANIHAISKRKPNISETPHATNTPDLLHQKMAALPMSTKASKVKTTSQIVAELAERKGDSKLAERATKLEEQHVRDFPGPATTLGMGRTTDNALVTRNKMDHLQRFLSSQPGPAFEEFPSADEDRGSVSSETEARGTTSAPVSPSRGPPDLPPPIMTPSNLDLLGVMPHETAEEILARLPPIDTSSIVWDDPEEQVYEQEQGAENQSGSEHSDSEDEMEKLVRQSEQVPSEDINTLHTTNLDCQNGNFDTDGKFREWHEVIVKKGYQDDPLIVLPYVITDF